MAALGPDGTAYVTQGQAEGILARLVEGVQGQMTALNAETRGLIDQLRLDVQQAITANGQAITTSEENAQRQVEALRSQAQAAAVNLDGKIAEAEARLASAIESAELYEANKKREEAEFSEKMAKLEKGIHDFVAETLEEHPANDCGWKIDRRKLDEAVPGKGSGGLRPKRLQD